MHWWCSVSYSNRLQCLNRQRQLETTKLPFVFFFHSPQHSDNLFLSVLYHLVVKMPSRVVIFVDRLDMRPKIVDTFYNSRSSVIQSSGKSSDHKLIWRSGPSLTSFRTNPSSWSCNTLNRSPIMPSLLESDCLPVMLPVRGSDSQIRIFTPRPMSIGVKVF